MIVCNDLNEGNGSLFYVCIPCTNRLERGFNVLTALDEDAVIMLPRVKI